MIGYLRKVVLIVGISFLLTAAFLAFDVAKFRSTAKKIDGSVTPSGSVQYLVEGYKHYYQPVLVYSGSNIRIIYSPNNPDAAKIDNPIELWFVPFIFTVLGLILTIVGYQRSAPFDWRQNGREVVAKFSAIKKTKLGQKLICVWQNPEDGKVYTFESNLAEINPKNIPADKRISVFIDPRNPNKYWVDLSFAL